MQMETFFTVRIMEKNQKSQRIFMWNSNRMENYHLEKSSFFVEVPLSSEHDYNFACIQPLCWQNSTELHLLNGLNRYVTDEVSEQQILVKLEDLKRIIGVFPLDKQINGKDMKVVVPF